MLNILSKLLSLDFLSEHNYVLIDSIDCKHITALEGTVNCFLDLYIDSENLEEFNGYFVIKRENSFEKDSELLNDSLNKNILNDNQHFCTNHLVQLTVYQDSTNLLSQNYSQAYLLFDRNATSPTDYSNIHILDDLYFVSMKFSGPSNNLSNAEKTFLKIPQILEESSNYLFLIMFSHQLIKLIHLVKKLFPINFSLVHSEDQTLTADISLMQSANQASFDAVIHSKPRIDVFIPKINSPSSLLDESLMTDLSIELPNKCVGHDVKLIYSMNINGTSLKTMIREVAKYESYGNKNMPYLLLIQDQRKIVFGALLSNPLKMETNYYGTGETCVFTKKDRLEIFKWTGKNDFFIYICNEYLSIGGGNGEVAIWLDESLDYGRSMSCDTFGNYVLSNDEDFHCSELELWTFYEPLINDINISEKQS